MDFILDILSTILAQAQKPTLAFLIGGMVLAALGSRLVVPEAIYKFIVVLLLLKVGLGAGIAMREADFMALAVPALAAAAIGVLIVLLGTQTLAAGMAMLDTGGVFYEGFIGALYPFMDVAALVTAIVLARLAKSKAEATQIAADGTATLTMGGGAGKPSGDNRGMVREILVDTFKSPAISALCLGLALGLFARPDSVYDGFYDMLFRGLLSVLMLIMGMEAWSRLSELRKVAHVYVLYGLTAPLVHGLIGLGLGIVVHHMIGFSGGGVVLLAVMAASSSDISGPPTMRGALPDANPSAYIGSSTGLGTPVAILSIPLWMAIVDMTIGL